MCTGQQVGADLGIYTRQVCQEVVSHSVQSIPRPLTEPVNGGAVDQTGELAQPLPEVSSYKAEAQHHV